KSAATCRATKAPERKWENYWRDCAQKSGLYYGDRFPRSGEGNGAMSERAIFLAALDKDPSERAAFLDEACAGNEALRRGVETLLRFHEQSHGFLDVPVLEQLAAAHAEPVNAVADLSFLAPSSEPGSLGRLDHYEILEVVGRGGTGVVLRARDT